MGDIYGNADHVMVCLPGIPHSELIGSDLHQLRSVYKRPDEIFTLRRAIRITNLKNRWGAIKSVMQDLYWGRLWIIQEVALAKQLYILAGNCVIEWEAIVELAHQQGPVITRQWEHGGPGGTFERTVMSGTIQGSVYIQRLDKLRCDLALRSEARCHLWDALPIARLSRATLDLDMLYGILGFCIEADDPLLRPDYGISVAQAYTNASILCLCRGSLKLLHLAGLAFRQLSSDIPSWVLDLRMNRTAGQDGISIYNNIELFTAAIGMAIETELSPAGDLLRIRGFLLDTIVACDSGRTLLENETHTSEFESGFSVSNFNMNPKDKAVVNILSRDRCLREYEMSQDQLIFTLMTMLHAPSGYMARIPEIVIRQIPEMYLGLIPRDEAYWRAVLAATPHSYSAPADADKSSVRQMAEMAITTGRSQQLMRVTYALIQSAEDAALFIKGCFFPLSLAAEELATIAASEILSKTLEALRVTTAVGSPTGARKFLGAYYASQIAHQVAVTERGYLALVPLGTQLGDVLCTFAGAYVPSVLRPSGDGDGSYRLWSGAAYVCLLMEGGAVREEGEDMWFRLR